MKIIKKCISLVKNFPQYLKRGGVTYINYVFSMNTNKLKHKNVVITGGASGIGYAIAKACISAGANVILLSRNLDKLNIAKEKLGDSCMVVQFDITNIKSINGIINEIEKNISGNIDCFVNCAGIPCEKDYFQVDDITYTDVMDTNLKGCFFFTRNIYEHMARNKVAGRIVFVSSNASIMGHVTPYGFSKASVNNYAVGLAKIGIKNGIRCNVVAPGVTCTAITDEFAKVDPNDNLYHDDLVDKRWHLPEEIAQVTVFLLSDDSSCVNGQVILCDGGDTLI